jgi:hypothetical protein
MSDRPVALLVIGVALLAVVTCGLAIVFPPSSPTPNAPIKVYAFCLAGPASTGGSPFVFLIVRNIGSSPLVGLAATVYLPSPFGVPFANISSSSPLAPNGVASVEIGSGAGVGIPLGVTYPLAFQGTYSTGAHFLEYTSFMLWCPHPTQ